MVFPLAVFCTGIFEPNLFDVWAFNKRPYWDEFLFLGLLRSGIFMYFLKFCAITKCFFCELCRICLVVAAFHLQVLIE